MDTDMATGIAVVVVWVRVSLVACLLWVSVCVGRMFDVMCVGAWVHVRVVSYLSNETPRAFIDPAFVHRSIIACVLSSED